MILLKKIKKGLTVVAFLHFVRGLMFTKQDILRVNLSRLDKFEVVGKEDCCKKINQWKLENREDKDYRLFLDEGIRQICNDNIFPLFVNVTNAEYIIINLVSDNNVNIVNILSNKKNTIPADKSLLDYHTYLIENNYNPNYYELKTNNKKQFLTVIFLNLLDIHENKLIQLKKRDYIEYLNQHTWNKHRTERKNITHREPKH